jgi:hypothetical protein
MYFIHQRGKEDENQETPSHSSLVTFFTHKKNHFVQGNVCR